jgi:hypothetical protein
MKPGIRIRMVRSDDDPILLEISSSNGESVFSHSVYAGFDALKKLVKELSNFRNHLHSGLYNIRFGQFGPEYGGGAFEARLHFQSPGRLFVTVKAESEWLPFKKDEVASSAVLYFKSEPILLDQFIEALEQLDSGKENEALLCGV